MKNETDYICFIVIRRFFICRDIRTVLQVITPFRATCSGGIFYSQQVVALQNNFCRYPLKTPLDLLIKLREKLFSKSGLISRRKNYGTEVERKVFLRGVNF